MASHAALLEAFLDVAQEWRAKQQGGKNRGGRQTPREKLGAGIGLTFVNGLEGQDSVGRRGPWQVPCWEHPGKAV